MRRALLPLVLACALLPGALAQQDAAHQPALDANASPVQESLADKPTSGPPTTGWLAGALAVALGVLGMVFIFFRRDAAMRGTRFYRRGRP